MRKHGKKRAKRLNSNGTHIYRGHVSGNNQKIIVASNANEAYALMLDAIAGTVYETNEVYADPEHNKYIQAYFRHYPIGAYDFISAANFINQLKVV